MPPQEINVTIFGWKIARFALIDDQHRYWTGAGWSPKGGRSLLYYHIHLAQADRRKLLQKQRRRRSS